MEMTMQNQQECNGFFCNIQNTEVDFWIMPIIQGFVQIEELVVNYSESSDDEKSSPETPPQESTCVDDIHPTFLVVLISRRSRHRAGKEMYPSLLIGDQLLQLSFRSLLLCIKCILESDGSEKSFHLDKECLNLKLTRETLTILHQFCLDFLSFYFQSLDGKKKKEAVMQDLAILMLKM